MLTFNTHDFLLPILHKHGVEPGGVYPSPFSWPRWFRVYSVERRFFGGDLKVGNVKFRAMPYVEPSGVELNADVYMSFGMALSAVEAVFHDERSERGFEVSRFIMFDQVGDSGALHAGMLRDEDTSTSLSRAPKRSRLHFVGAKSP